jgi:hypothetical protein
MTASVTSLAEGRDHRVFYANWSQGGPRQVRQVGSSKLRHHRPLLVKMDIEGAEWELFLTPDERLDWTDVLESDAPAKPRRSPRDSCA